MPKLHRITAYVVMVAAGAWIATGEFASIGSADEAGVEKANVDEAGTDEASAAADGAAVAAPEAPAILIRTVTAITPEFIDHARAIRLSGITEADKHATLAARADGVIATLALAKGGLVTGGQEVMTLEGPETQAQAEIAEINLAQRERELQVAQKLFEGGSSSETALDNARSARDSAAAELARARAAADRLALKAPFAGLVSTLNVELGEWVQTGTPVATILALDPIIVKAEVSEIDLGSIAEGSTADLRLVNGVEGKGTLRLVSREASVATRTYPVEITLPNPDLALPAGMTAEVVLYAAPVRAVVVPRSIITLSESGELGLRVVGADRLAQFAPITVIDDTPDGLVVAGLPEGVRIITSGQDLVRNGDEVVVAGDEVEAGSTDGADQ